MQDLTATGIMMVMGFMARVILYWEEMEHQVRKQTSMPRYMLEEHLQVLQVAW